MRTRHWGIAASLLAGTAISAAAYATREAGAVVAPVQRMAADDTASLARLLTAVRNANPLFCELATRMADGRNYWSSGGGGSLIEVDSASSALIRWVHTSHRDPRLVARLAAGLRDSDRCVRRLAGALLGRVDHSAATSALFGALDDESADTRSAAAIGLGLAEEQSAVQPLVRRLRDTSPTVRRSAAWALGAIENKSALLPLIELLERDADPRVRQAAAWAIGEVTG